MKKKKQQYIAVFLLDQGGVPNIIGRKKFNIAKKTISYKHKSFTINPDIFSFREGLKVFYLFDFGGTGQLLLNQGSEKQVMAVEMMDEVTNEEIILQILKANELKKNWMDIILGLVAGLGVGLFIGQMIPGMMS